MNTFIIVMLAIMSGIIVLLISQITELYYRIDYLEKKYIDIRSNIADIHFRMGDK